MTYQGSSASQGVVAEGAISLERNLTGAVVSENLFFSLACTKVRARARTLLSVRTKRDAAADERADDFMKS